MQWWAVWALVALALAAGAGCSGRSALDESPASGPRDAATAPIERSVLPPSRRAPPIDASASRDGGADAASPGAPPPGFPRPPTVPPDASSTTDEDAGLEPDLDAG